MTAVIVAAAAVFGLAIGSFLDVVAYRLPRGLSLLRPPSFCPSCRATLTWADNIPVASWLVLRGRCRRCGAAIPARALLVEAGTGLGFAGVALALGRTWAVPGACLLVATGIVLAATASDGSDLPGLVVLVGTGMGAAALAGAAGIGGHWPTFVHAALGAAAAGAGAFVGRLALTRMADGGGTVADGLGALVPAGTLLGWLGAVPAAIGGASAVVGALAVAVLLPTSGLDGRRGRPRAQGEDRPPVARGRLAVTLVCLVGVAGALVAAGVAGGG